jgi:SAM-dependent methyltransferase
VASGKTPGYNKLCELEDFRDETLGRWIRELAPADAEAYPDFPVGREHRKWWEFAQAARSLTNFGAIHRDAEILGVGAGHETTIFWATNHVRRVFATDLHLDPGVWGADARQSMLLTPGEYAFLPWNERRLVVQHMNALDLHYEDESFDGVFSSSSIEHFGDSENVRRALAEMCRVLKPGGVASITTEFRLRGRGPGFPGALVFSAADLDNVIIRPLPWEPVEPLDLTLSKSTRKTEVTLADTLAGTAPDFPHIVVRHGKFLFTSVHLALRKQAD